MHLLHHLLVCNAVDYVYFINCSLGAPPQAPGYYRHAPHVNRNWEAPLPPGPNPPPQIFYPSQDPHHLGSRAHPPRSNI